MQNIEIKCCIFPESTSRVHADWRLQWCRGHLGSAVVVNCVQHRKCLLVSSEELILTGSFIENGLDDNINKNTS